MVSAVAATPRSVFITGALGLIGAQLAERYRAAGAEVRAWTSARTRRRAWSRATSRPGCLAGRGRRRGAGDPHRRDPRDGPRRRGRLLAGERARHAPCARRGGARRSAALRPFLLHRDLRARLPGRRRRALPAAADRRALRRHEGRGRAGGVPGARRRRDGLHHHPPGRRLRAAVELLDDSAGAGDQARPHRPAGDGAGTRQPRVRR